MLKEWNYWRRYHPVYGITNITLKVTKLSQGYQMYLSFQLICRNRDGIEELRLDCIGMNAELRGKIKGRKRDYPVTYQEGVPVWRISPHGELKPEQAQYILTSFSDFRPFLGKVASCRRIIIGTATLIHGTSINITKLLKLHGFDVTVIWEETNAKA